MNLLLADALVAAHFLFIAFVVAGGALVIFWPRAAWLHLPAALWGAVVEFTGWICPLTPLENHFRALGGSYNYSGDFIAQYLLPLIYPENLTREIQFALGAAVVAINIIFYTLAIRRHRRVAAG
ncbi:MAG TPA: DUF2784 domain-containing protein [Smithellaceae bacterium]|nr:DUF2784 domain-containing protein [Smithellaceae bacterium]HRS89308.1 DUF2784 domain-containing protein [Smithellaceae bacterium]HRV25178.1 DUF2784 domain-containing protein [Smithellaceae bacterium]